MRRRDLLAGVAGTAGAVGVYGAASLLTGGESGTRGGSGSRGDSDPFEPLGSVAIEGARELVTSEDGSVAYLAVDDGIATVDLSDPASPTVLTAERGLLADETDGPLQLVWDVSLDGDRLLAAGPANSRPNAINAAVLFDVSDPAEPVVLDHVATSHAIHNCFLGDGVGYLTANGQEGNPLVLLDASDDELEEVGRWSILAVDDGWREVHWGLCQLHDVTVQDGVAYLPYWDAGTYLLDVSDPADPSYLGHTSDRDRTELTDLGLADVQAEILGPPGNSHFVEPDGSGDLIAVGREAWAVPAGDCTRGGPGGIDLYDASDPTAIERLATIDAPEAYANTRGSRFTTAHNFELRDDRLYSSWYFGGVKLHDVSDPESPEELAWWRDPETTSFWTARSAVPGEHFVASSAGNAGGFDDSIEGGVYVFPDAAGRPPDPPDLTDPPAGADPPPEC